MQAIDPDPDVRWPAVVAWYEEWVTDGHEYMKPMAELMRWVASEPFRESLFAYTSLATLVVWTPRPDLEYEPAFTCTNRPPSEIEFELLHRGYCYRHSRVLHGFAKQTFKEYVRSITGSRGDE